MIDDQFNIITKLLFFYNEMFIMNLFAKFKTITTSFKVRAKFFYHNKLFKKRYLALGFILLNIPALIHEVHQNPQKITLLSSKAAQKLSEIQIPNFARNFIYGTYSKLYEVNQQEMIKGFSQYKTFSEFFSRKIKQRKIEKIESALLSPSDSKIIAFGQIKQDSVFTIKGYSYSLGHLFTGQEVQFSTNDIENIKKHKQNKLYHVVLYLSPGDYHRFHSTCKFEIFRRKAIQGALFSVKQNNLNLRKKVYQKNSRLILHGKWKQGYLGLVLVGGLNVGRIIVKDKLIYEAGQQIGYFNLGSTIVLIIQSPNIQWNIKEQQKIRYGQILGKTNQILKK